MLSNQATGASRSRRLRGADVVMSRQNPGLRGKRLSRNENVRLNSPTMSILRLSRRLVW